jgi:hypothetical protein
MHPNPRPGPAPPDNRALIHAAIAHKAYHLWERDGYPAHRAEATWLEAERDLLAVQKWRQAEPTLPVSF